MKHGLSYQLDHAAIFYKLVPMWCVVSATGNDIASELQVFHLYVRSLPLHSKVLLLNDLIDFYRGLVTIHSGHL